MRPEVFFSVPGWVEVARAAAVEFTGEDRIEWLQGQATQNLAGLPDFSLAQACFLTPLGQIEAVASIAILPGRVVAVTEQPEKLLERAERFVIMEDVAARRLPGAVITCQGEGLDGAFATESGQVLLGESKSGVWLRSSRSPAGGWDLIGLEPISGATPGLPEELDAAMLEAGRPRLGLDTPEKCLPADLGPGFFDAHVSTTKGCYQGQEVVHRMFARGRAPKRWAVLVTDRPLDAQTPVMEGGRSVGVVLRSAPSPRHGWLASVMVSSEAGGVLTAAGSVLRQG